MTAPAITLAALAKLNPCPDRLVNAQDALPKRRRITAAMAREAGMSFDDIVWVASVLARNDKDVERRLRLWMADCAARVLHIYEKTETSDAPRKAIIAARQYARGEIDPAASAAASAAARAAARDAASAAASAAARAAARDAASAAARDAAWAAAWDAEEAWQFDRLIAWLSDNEPADLALPKLAAKAA